MVAAIVGCQDASREHMCASVSASGTKKRQGRVRTRQAKIGILEAQLWHSKAAGLLGGDSRELC